MKKEIKEIKEIKTLSKTSLLERYIQNNINNGVEGMDAKTLASVIKTLLQDEDSSSRNLN